MKIGVVAHTIGMMLLVMLIQAADSQPLPYILGYAIAVGAANAVLFTVIAGLTRFTVHVWEQIQRG